MPATYDQENNIEWLANLAGGILDLNDDPQGHARDVLTLLGVELDAQGDPVPPPKPVEPLPPGNLSPHFTMAELTFSGTAQAMGIDNTPDAATAANLGDLAVVLEEVRTICGDNPVFISSGYRSPPVNRAVGGASNSAHLFGLAADFTIPAFGDVVSICRELEPHMGALGIDQLINESGGGACWVHLGLPIPPNTIPRCMAFTISNGTTTDGFA